MEGEGGMEKREGGIQRREGKRRKEGLGRWPSCDARHEDPCWIYNTHVKAIPVLGRRDRRIPGTQWKGSLTKSVNFKDNKLNK